MGELIIIRENKKNPTDTKDMHTTHKRTNLHTHMLAGARAYTCVHEDCLHSFKQVHTWLSMGFSTLNRNT